MLETDPKVDQLVHEINQLLDEIKQDGQAPGELPPRIVLRKPRTMAEVRWVGKDGLVPCIGGFETKPVDEEWLAHTRDLLRNWVNRSDADRRFHDIITRARTVLTEDELELLMRSAQPTA